MALPWTPVGMSMSNPHCFLRWNSRVPITLLASLGGSSPSTRWITSAQITYDDAVDVSQLKSLRAGSDSIVKEPPDLRNHNLLVS
jgi:hypothetical protein